MQPSICGVERKLQVKETDNCALGFSGREMEIDIKR